MKPLPLTVPARDLGRARIRDFGEALIRRLESLENRLAAKDPVRTPVALTAERALLGRLDSQAGDVVTLERQRIRDRALDEEYFRRELGPGVCLYVGAITEVQSLDCWVMRFPNGADTSARRQFATRDLWIGTRPRMTIWYTSPVGSTATFDFRFALTVFGAGSTTGLTPITVDWSAAGPAVANDILTTSAVITSSRFPSSPFGVTHLRCNRRGAGDANANDLDILLAVVTMEEVA